MAPRLHSLPLATRCRLEFLAGLVEGWERRHGRPITADELRRGLRRYPADPDVLIVGPTIKPSR